MASIKSQLSRITGR